VEPLRGRVCRSNSLGCTQ